VLAITLLAVLGAAYALFRRLLTPLELVGDAMLRLARGDLRYRIRLARRDELGRLFAAFNLMAGTVQAKLRRPVVTGRPRPVAVPPAPRASDGTAPRRDQASKP
jgi:serine/threonine-protein kinase